MDIQMVETSREDKAMPTLEQIFGNDIVTPDETFTEFTGGVCISSNSKILDDTDEVTPMAKSLVAQSVDLEFVTCVGVHLETGEVVGVVYNIIVRDLPEKCWGAEDSSGIPDSACDRIINYAFLDKKSAIAAYCQIVSDNLSTHE